MDQFSQEIDQIYKINLNLKTNLNSRHMINTYDHVRRRRLRVENQYNQNDPCDFSFIEQSETDQLTFTAILIGPQNSPYEGAFSQISVITAELYFIRTSKQMEAFPVDQSRDGLHVFNYEKFVSSSEKSIASLYRKSRRCMYIVGNSLIKKPGNGQRNMRCDGQIFKVNKSFKKINIKKLKVHLILFSYTQLQYLIQAQDGGYLMQQQEKIDFCCNICYEKFDNNKKKPLYICPSHHTLCKACFDGLLAKDEDQRRCHMCRAPLDKQMYQEFTFLSQIREVVLKLKQKGSIFRKQQQKIKKSLEEKEKELTQQKEKCNWLATQTQNWYLECQKLKKQLKEKNRENEYLKVSIKESQDKNMCLNERLKDQEAEYIKMKLQLQAIEEIIHPRRQINYNNDHSFNPDSYRFQTRLNRNKLQITLRQADYNCDSFILNRIIPLNSTTIFRIRLIKTKNQDVLLGIRNESIFGQINAYQKDKQDCLLYHLTGGMSLEEGGQINRIAVRDEQMISIVINTKKWFLKWMLRDLQLAATQIPQQMKNQKLYIIVLMFYKSNTEFLDSSFLKESLSQYESIKFESYYLSF